MAQHLKSVPAGGAVDRLKSEATDLIGALGDRAVSSVKGKVEGATERLTDYAESGAGPGLMAAMTGAKGLAEGKSPAKAVLGAGATAVKEKVKSMFGKGGKDKKQKITNIIESIDVGVPVKLAYNQFTQFTDFPSFMKKVESVEQAEDEKLNWKAQVLWSHRTWESTILEQVPDDKIVWRSKGEKGYVDGAVTFHELAPNLTRVLVVLEYHPQGLFEHTGNIWRAQGRRVRLELKHFRRQLMSDTLLHSDEVEGWRGEIHDGEVVDGAKSRGRSTRSKGRQGDKDEPAQGRSSARKQSSGTGARRTTKSESGSRNTRARAGQSESNGRATGSRRPSSSSRSPSGARRSRQTSSKES